MVKETLLFEGVCFQPLTMNEWGDFELLFNGQPACQDVLVHVLADDPHTPVRARRPK